VEKLEAVVGNCHVLDQCVEVLRRMDDETYVSAGADEGSPVGTHFRHIFDHYQLLLEGLVSGRIDYDARRRDPRLERERGQAIDVALGIRNQLNRLRADQGSHPLQVSLRSLAEENEPDWSGSTVRRELQFLVSHTVHHCALIKQILRQYGFDAGVEFGLAPSTKSHLQRQTACAH
jgi:hypothetical protein